MVSFVCDNCQDTVKKPKLDQHSWNCRSTFTCVDCSTTFSNSDAWKKHTTCISEAEKYQKSLYKGKKPVQETKKRPAEPEPIEEPVKKVKETKESKTESKTESSESSKLVDIIPTIKSTLAKKQYDWNQLKKKVTKKLSKDGHTKEQVMEAMDKLVFEVKGDDIVLSIE